MSSVLVVLLLGALLLGTGIATLVFAHRVVAKAPLSKDDYVVPAMAGTLITGLLACGAAFLIEAALIMQVVREISITLAICPVVFIVARLFWRRHEAQARRLPPTQALGA